MACMKNNKKKQSLDLSAPFAVIKNAVKKWSLLPLSIDLVPLLSATR